MRRILLAHQGKALVVGYTTKPAGTAIPFIRGDTTVWPQPIGIVDRDRPASRPSNSNLTPG